MKATTQHVAKTLRDSVSANHPAGQLFSSVYAEAEIALAKEQMCTYGGCETTSMADSF